MKSYRDHTSGDDNSVFRQTAGRNEQQELGNTREEIVKEMSEPEL